MKNGIKRAIGPGILAAIVASMFLVPHIRKTACEKKYEGYFDRLEYAQYTLNPKQALATLDSITVPNDCLCDQEARKVEYQKYAEKAYFFSGVFNNNSHPNLDSTLLYCKKALDLADKMKKKDLYVSVGDIYLLMGLTYEKTGDCDNALLFADRAIASCKNDEDMLTHGNALGIKTRCLKKLGRNEETKSLNQKADNLEKEILKKASEFKH